MNVLFLTLVKIGSLEDRNIYCDLLRKFRDEGHEVFVVNPSERREKRKTSLKKEPGANLLNVWTFNLQKTNVFEKGIATLAVEHQFLKAVKKNFANVKFDLVLYSTPPITFYKVIDFIKKRDNAYTYLLLKDIFPQNAVDMGMLKEQGFLHKLFLKKERKLYEVSDAIGCMSQANMDYLLNHNSYLNPEKVEVNPNSIEPVAFEMQSDGGQAILKKYGLPLNKKIFVYGGNLGKPQGLGFLRDVLLSSLHDDAFMLIIGLGTEYNALNKWFNENTPVNARLMKGLPKNDYDSLLGACYAGLIFLDRHFTIPNFPSRLIVLSLYTIMMLSPMPARSCRKKTGPLESSFINTAHNNSIGNTTISRQHDKMTSKNLLKNNLYIII